jgi:hypothetical protein
MFPTGLLFAATLGLAVAVIMVGLIIGLRTYFRYRGKMLIICPETGKPAAVDVAAGDAAVDSLLGKVKIHLKDCTRWPERQDCGQECLRQIEPDPKHCLVWTLVANWYADQSCAYCHKPFGEVQWHEHRPALLSPEGKTVQWNDVPVDRLPSVFATHRPICWNCHIAESFRREHPELVLDRPWKRGPMGEIIPEDERLTKKHDLVA